MQILPRLRYLVKIPLSIWNESFVIRVLRKYKTQSIDFPLIATSEGGIIASREWEIRS